MSQGSLGIALIVVGMLFVVAGGALLTIGYNTKPVNYTSLPIRQCKAHIPVFYSGRSYFCANCYEWAYLKDDKFIAAPTDTIPWPVKKTP